MPKKKGHKKFINQDFTINDCANAPKPVSRVKKAESVPVNNPEISWDQIDNEEYDIVEEVDADGTKSLVYKKKKRPGRSEDNIETRPGIVYPEIVWYLISHYIKPEEVGKFAGINKATYTITQRESFWRTLYNRYCWGHPQLPERLRIEDSYKVYGLRQRVIRALYHTYEVFIKNVEEQAIHDSRPHLLVKRTCLNVCYFKRRTHWTFYFKFKKTKPLQRLEKSSFLDELGRIDANPEDDVQVLKVRCRNFQQVPPLMGMTLTSLSVTLAPGFKHHRLQLGFNTGHHVSRDILPECSVVINNVAQIFVYNWWHPRYPHFENRLPSNGGDDAVPVLKKDFFNTCDGD